MAKGHLEYSDQNIFLKFFGPNYLTVPVGTPRNFQSIKAHQKVKLWWWPHIPETNICRSLIHAPAKHNIRERNKAISGIKQCLACSMYQKWGRSPALLKYCLGSKKTCSNCTIHLEMVAFPLHMSMFNRCCKLPRHSKVEGPLAPPVLWGWYFPSFFHLRCVFSKDSWPTMGDELSAEQSKTKDKQFLGAPNSDFDKDTEMLSYSHGDPHT